jgi:hypothetical protein
VPAPAKILQVLGQLLASEAEGASAGRANRAGGGDADDDMPWDDEEDDEEDYETDEEGDAAGAQAGAEGLMCRGMRVAGMISGW